MAAALGPRVIVDNPLDYHTYIWADEVAMVPAFEALLSDPGDLNLFFADLPRSDRCAVADWLPGVRAFARACRRSGARGAYTAAMSGNLHGPLADELVAQGLAVLAPPSVAVAAVEAARTTGSAWAAPAAPPVFGIAERVGGAPVDVDEEETKTLLARGGVRVPAGRRCRTPAEVADFAATQGRAVVVKALGVAHKSDVGAVRLGVRPEQAAAVAGELFAFSAEVLVEQQVADVVAEVLVSVEERESYGPVLTIGWGGVFVEALGDVAHVLLPCKAADIVAALATLRIARLLRAPRGHAPIAESRVAAAAQAIVDVFTGNDLMSLEVNPLLVTPQHCWAADALAQRRGPAGSGGPVTPEGRAQQAGPCEPAAD